MSTNADNKDGGHDVEMQELRAIDADRATATPSAEPPHQQGHPLLATTGSDTSAASTSSPRPLSWHGSIVLHEQCGRQTCCLPCDFCCRGCASTTVSAYSQPPLSPRSSEWWLRYIVGVPEISRRRLCESYFVNERTVIWTRAFMTLYTTTVLISSLANDMYDGFWFFYFTNLSYVGLVVYLWSTLYANIRYRMDEHRHEKRAASLLDIFCTIMFATLFTFHILVPAVYWILLAPGLNLSKKTEFEQWINFSVHGLDFVVVFVEFLLTRVIYIWGQLVFCIGIMVLYLFWTWIGHLLFPTSGPLDNGFPYFFVDYRKPINGAFMIGLMLFVCLLWSLTLAMHWGKAVLGKRYRARRAVVREEPSPA